MSNTPKPVLSVCMITFMQEIYLEKAIESILIQDVDFEFELIILDDHSSDNTENIVKFLINNHPKGNWIKYFRHEKNLGMMPNFEWALNQCSGKYIATCEGDDYWTDPFKLQKQVDFLEANPDFVICFHPVKVLSRDGTFSRDYGVSDLLVESETDIYDLATFGNYMHTPSVVFRNLIREFPVNFKQSKIGDYFLWMLLAEKGKIKRLDDYMAVYRKGVGVQSSIGEKQFFIDFSKSLDLISSSIENITVKQIIKFRRDSIRFNFLPFSIKNTLDSEDVSKGIVLRKHVKIRELFKAIYYKIFNI